MKCRIDIKGSKIWIDNNNLYRSRPSTVEIILKRDGQEFRTVTIDSNGDGVYKFVCLPVWSNSGHKYQYSIDEKEIPVGYKKTIDGYNIINTLDKVTIDCSKTWEDDNNHAGHRPAVITVNLMQNGNRFRMLQVNSPPDYEDMSYFSFIDLDFADSQGKPFVYTIDEDKIDRYIKAINGFDIINTFESAEISLNRATAVTPAYMAAPNTWRLHGTTLPDLYMRDKILLTMPTLYTVETVKWEYGIKDAAYFEQGGIDITSSYKDGILIDINSDYTVYILFSDGSETVSTITIDRLRDGTTQMPYLLIDYTTAEALEPSIPGINEFILDYMQGGGVKLSQHYEIYESIEMSGRTWEPLGTYDEAFTGSLYGNGHDIKNLLLGSISTNDYLGIFRFVSDGASIQNLKLTNFYVESYYISSGFAGYIFVRNGGTVLFKDLRFEGILKGRWCSGIAGNVGVMDGTLIIEDCYTDATIETSEPGGGIVAAGQVNVNSSLSITNCYASGSLKGEMNSAGIIGLLASNGVTNITNCLNAMKIECNDTAGGIVGRIEGSGAANVASCYNKADISGAICGGIAGIGEENTALVFKILNSYNSGKIAATSCGGGVYGSYNFSNITQYCYNVGIVTSVTNAGGISGNYGNIENCAALNQQVASDNNSARISPGTNPLQMLANNLAYNNMEVLIGGVQKSPLDTGTAGADGISISASIIKTQNVYENIGWDFTNVWTFGNAGYTLPILRGIPANLQPDVLPPHLV